MRYRERSAAPAGLCDVTETCHPQDFMASTGDTRRYATHGLYTMASLTGLLTIFMILSCSHSLPIRTAKLSGEGDYYMNGDIRCLRCAAGELLRTPCTIQDSRGVCQPCPHDTYSEHPSGMSECLRCSRCRQDQEEVTPCSPTKNTVCRCKKGSFCLPGHPCEICTPCTTSCPEDQVEQAPCNATSDIHCASPGESTYKTNVGIACGAVAILVIGIIGVCVYKCLKRRNRDQGLGLIKQHENNGDIDSKTQLLPRYNLEFKEGIGYEEREETISKSRAIIVDLVPPKKFETLMLKLGLGTNLIERAKMDGRYTEEQNQNMLREWYQQQSNFDVNQVLKALHSLKLDSAADEIAKRLIEEGLYIQKAAS